MTKYIKQIIGFVFFISFFRLYYNSTDSTYSTDSKHNYHPNTFGIDLYDDPCKHLSAQQFRANINNPNHKSYVKCNSNICKDDAFIGSITTIAYDVEHIIDNNGPEYKNCNKDIVGNYVMTKNKWNQILEIVAKFDYDKSTMEKTKVYGNQMMNRVRLNIEKCCAKEKISRTS
jgi:hypothetical protein